MSLGTDTHEDFAMRVYIKRHRELFAEVDEDDLEDLYLPSKLDRLREEAYNELLDDGWIRVSNWSNFEVAELTKPPDVAWRRAAEITADCMARAGGNPEEVFVHVGYGWNVLKVTVPEFVLRYGDRALVEAMFRRLMP